MQVTVRYFDGCPNWKEADARFRAALAATETAAAISYERVDLQEEAERLRFTGSPTILVDGSDLFPLASASYGLTCRIYRTETGNQGSPSVGQLKVALLELVRSHPRG